MNYLLYKYLIIDKSNKSIAFRLIGGHVFHNLGIPVNKKKLANFLTKMQVVKKINSRYFADLGEKSAQILACCFRCEITNENMMVACFLQNNNFIGHGKKQKQYYKYNYALQKTYLEDRVSLKALLPNSPLFPEQNIVKTNCIQSFSIKTGQVKF